MCAETVKSAAVRCRFCGYNFVEPNPQAAPHREPKSAFAAFVDSWVDRSKAPPRRSSGCATIGAFLGLLILGFIIFAGTSGGGDAPKPAQEFVDEATFAKCNDIVDQAVRSQLVRREDREAKRVYVDQRLWAELGPDARLGVTGAVACKWFRVKIGGTTIEDGVTVVSSQSGKRLSSAHGGMYFDSVD